MTNTIYRFRVSIQDLPSPDFLLHIFVQHDQPPKYLELLDKIKLHSKTEITNTNEYYMVIEKDNVFKYKFKDDLGLQHAFKSITDKDKLEIKLMRQVPLVKPIFTRRPSAIEEDEQMYCPTRKDSGISLEQEMEELRKEEEPDRARKLPALSHIITTELWSSNSLPSPPTQQMTHSSSSSSSFYSSGSNHNNNHYQQKQLAPIHAYHPVRFGQKPLSPPLSASSPSSPYSNNIHSNHPLLPTKNKLSHKRTRGSTSHQSQFICEHVIDTLTGKTCCQAFRRSYDLSRHQTIHLENRPLCYCHECGKKFTRLDALRRHERIQGHTNNNNNNNK
ncbi:hypothetical protein BD770DRAFT_406124 [Pilaira anomala]|nr:hypothetical protein BD770DRAFT_406124 [Pilaira anomala]